MKRKGPFIEEADNRHTRHNSLLIVPNMHRVMQLDYYHRPTTISEKLNVTPKYKPDIHQKRSPSLRVHLSPSLHFLLRDRNWSRYQSSRRSTLQVLSSAAATFPDRPSCPDERGSSRSVCCQKEPEGPPEDVRCEDTEQQECVIPTRVVDIGISSACTRNYHLRKLFHWPSTHMYLWLHRLFCSFS